jgi:hypothetical protein
MFVELGLLVLAVILFFAHGLWLFFYERRLQRLTASARDSLAHLATRGTVNVEEIEALRGLPHDVQVIAFLEMSRHLSGAAKERLSFVAGQVGVVDRARKLCESGRRSRRLRGSRDSMWLIRWFSDCSWILTPPCAHKPRNGRPRNHLSQ